MKKLLFILFVLISSSCFAESINELPNPPIPEWFHDGEWFWGNTCTYVPTEITGYDTILSPCEKYSKQEPAGIFKNKNTGSIVRVSCRKAAPKNMRHSQPSAESFIIDVFLVRANFHNLDKVVAGMPNDQKDKKYFFMVFMLYDDIAIRLSGMHETEEKFAKESVLSIAETIYSYNNKK